MGRGSGWDRAQGGVQDMVQGGVQDRVRDRVQGMVQDRVQELTASGDMGADVRLVDSCRTRLAGAPDFI